MKKRRCAAVPSIAVMASIDSITLEVADPTAARRFYSTAFGLGPELRLVASDSPTSGFRGYTLSLVMSQPADVSALFDDAVAAGATVLKPASKSLWGFGGVLHAPDGTIWKIATSSKKDKGPVTREIEKIVLLLGVEDVGATKQFYVDHGLPVARSFGHKYVEYEAGAGAVTLGLYRRRALAKDAGVAADGSGSHRLIVGSDAAAFTDPDGFEWAPAAVAAA
jgi:catechol 2,3-dioxygenase-like lactoylglutathione lyase family enzyme